MILVKAAPGLVIEFGVNESGQWNRLSLRLSGVSPDPFLFEVQAGPQGGLLARALDTRPEAELAQAQAAIAANEAAILAEVHKYNRYRG